MWTYTLPAERTVEIVNEAGYPLFTSAELRAGDGRDGRLPRCCASAAVAAASARSGHAPAARKCAQCWRLRARFCANGRRGRLLAAYGIGGGERGELAHSAAEAEKLPRRLGGRWRSKFSPPIFRTRPKPAPWQLSLPPPTRCAPPIDRVLRQRQASRAGGSHRRGSGAADGAAGPRNHSRHQPRPDMGSDADGRPRRRAGRGARRCRALAGAA